jgi:hypothetical protein
MQVLPRFAAPRCIFDDIPFHPRMIGYGLLDFCMAGC